MGAFAFSGAHMRTTVYVDGFNLYYGCLKGTPYKWLDLKSLFRQLLEEQNQIDAIKYFTAKIKAKPGKATSPQEQQAYLRALEAHIPEIEIILGHFLIHNVRMPAVSPPPITVEVIKSEEKGSDVNLSVHLLNDAWLDKFDCAVIVTNDSDMAEAMRLVKFHHPNKILGIVTPGRKNEATGQRVRTSKQLKASADFVRTIRPGLLQKSLLPNPIPGTNISKPAEW